MTRIRFNNIPAYTLGTGSFTVEGWVWLENTPSGNERTIISKMHVNPGSGEIGGFRLFVNAAGRLQFTVGDAPVTPSGPGRQASITYNFALPNQQWIHVIAVRNGNNPNLWQMYMNGMMVPCIITGPTLPTGNIEQGAPHFIDIGGGAMVGNPKSWNGRLKKVRLYAGILSPTIINNTYNSGCGTDFAISPSRLDAPLYERLTPTTTREYGNSQTGTLTTVVPGQLQWNAYWKDSNCTASDTITLWCKQVMTYRGKNKARYGFNGMERYDDMYGEGNAYDFGARVYDSRLGRWFSVDAYIHYYPHLTPYCFGNDNPIVIIDQEGNFSKDAIKKLIANSISAIAEFGHKLYKKSKEELKKNPAAANEIKKRVKQTAKAVESVTDMNTQTMGWLDLTSMWLFELGNTDHLKFDGDDFTTKDLMDEEGVVNATTQAFSTIVGNNTTYKLEDFTSQQGVDIQWKYGQKEFYDCIEEQNVATAFLGTYSTNIRLEKINETSYKATITVVNTTSWESGTRFRKDIDNNGSHDGIIENTVRGKGIGLGGNLKQTWQWTEIWDTTPPKKWNLMDTIYMTPKDNTSTALPNKPQTLKKKQ